MSYAQTATTYAERVTDGTIIACKWIRLAAARHLENLVRPDFPFAFDDDAANRACEFIELLPHTKGRWAARREKLILQPWQIFIVASIFGWLSKETKLRRFREAYICCPRKQGKSPLAAAIGHYMLECDGEAGAEVVCGAGTERQAWEIFRPARLMAIKSPDLRKVMGVSVHAKALTVDSTGGRFVPVVGDPGDGASISCALLDEFHEADTSVLYDCFKTSQVGREQPLLLVITTAGFNTASPCYDLQTTAQKVLEGTLLDEQLFVVIYTIDAGTDWTTEAALWMANPNLGVSVSLETLLRDQKLAVKNAAKQGVFRTKHLCEWMTASAAYFNLVKWNAGADATLNEADFKAFLLYIGMDLASVLDLSSVVKVYVQSINGKLHFYVFARHYLPEDRISLAENQMYQKWAEDGLLIPCEGAMLDYSQVRADLTADIEAHSVEALCYDKRYCDQLTQELYLATGVTLVEVPQLPAFLSLPMKSLDAAIQDGRVHHTGDPVLTWCMSNVVSKVRGPSENAFPEKQKPANKIDGAVALLNAMNRALTAESTAGKFDSGFFIG
jgi:phage terminase large subunit-like protein